MQRDLNLLKSVLSVPTKTYQEDLMIEFLIDWMRENKIEYSVDEHWNVYATKGEISENSFYPCVVAHTDTVHNIVDEIIVKEEHLLRPYTFGKDFGNEQVLCLKAYDKEDKPTGIGGDDKCGIFICLELLKLLLKLQIYARKLTN